MALLITSALAVGFDYAGETLDLLLRDDDLILALALAAPSGGGGESS